MVLIILNEHILHYKNTEKDLSWKKFFIFFVLSIFRIKIVRVTKQSLLFHELFTLLLEITKDNMLLWLNTRMCLRHPRNIKKRMQVKGGVKFFDDIIT